MCNSILQVTVTPVCRTWKGTPLACCVQVAAMQPAFISHPSKPFLPQSLQLLFQFQPHLLFKFMYERIFRKKGYNKCFLQKTYGKEEGRRKVGVLVYPHGGLRQTSPSLGYTATPCLKTKRSQKKKQKQNF